MDEPLSNLDAKLRLEMRYELQRLHVETGSTFVYVTHDQMEAMTLATRICLIDNGLLQQYDAPLTVYGRPNNTFVADFVGNPAINFIEGKGRQAADGSIAIDILGGRKVIFRPKEPIKIADWYAAQAKADEERRQAEAEKAKQKGYVEKGNKDTLFRHHIAKVDELEDFGDEYEATEDDFVIGVRPEFLDLRDDGAIEGEIYSAMPTGMETTVKVQVGEFLLTGVVFGGVLYELGQKVRCGFRGDDIVLFSRKNGRFIAQGSLTIE
jgi:ABC-type sugar transport system ATPase subunit